MFLLQVEGLILHFLLYLTDRAKLLSRARIDNLQTQKTTSSGFACLTYLNVSNVRCWHSADVQMKLFHTLNVYGQILLVMVK